MLCAGVRFQVDVTSKTEGKVDNSHMLVKYDARLRDNVAVNVVQEVTDTVQVCWAWGGSGLHILDADRLTDSGLRQSGLGCAVAAGRVWWWQAAVVASSAHRQAASRQSAGTHQPQQLGMECRAARDSMYEAGAVGSKRHWAMLVAAASACAPAGC